MSPPDSVKRFGIRDEIRNRSGFLDKPAASCHAWPMREKELRLALVCYGGISLAVYMHGITKEIWRLARASRASPSDPTPRA